MSRFGLVGPTYASKSLNVDAERCINWVPTRADSPLAKSPMWFDQRGGLKSFIQLNEPSVRRGFVQNGRVFVVGQSFYEIFANGSITNYGNLAASASPPAVAGVQNQLLILANNDLWTFTLATNALAKVDTAQLGGANNIAMIGALDSFFVALRINSNTLQLSNLLDGMTWSGLNVGAVSYFPDNIVSMMVDHGEIWLWGSKNSAVYYDTGAAFFPISPNPSARIEQGSIALNGVAKLDNTIYGWGWSDERGGVTAFRVQGYSHSRISTHGIESIVKGFPLVSDAVSYALEDEGHSFFVTYFPSADRTLVFDVASGMWSEWDFFDNGTSHAFLGSCHFAAFGKHLVGDRSSGQLYEYSTNYYDDNGNPIRRVRISPPTTKERKRLFFHRLDLDVETGQASKFRGLAPPVMILPDDNDNPWSVQIEDATGRPIITSVSGMAVSSLFINDNQISQSWQIIVTDNGNGDMVLATKAVALGPYPQSFLLPTNANPARQNRMFVANGQIETDGVEDPKRQPEIYLEWTNDGGHTWSNPLSRGLGFSGQYGKLVHWDRLGSSRNRAWRLTCTDPVPVRIIDGYLDASDEDGQPVYQPAERLVHQMGKMA